MNKIFLITGFRTLPDNSTEPVVEELTYEELLKYRKPIPKEEPLEQEIEQKDEELLDSQSDLC